MDGVELTGRAIFPNKTRKDQGQLSGGQEHVAVARTPCVETNLTFLVESTPALDPGGSPNM